MGDATAGNQAIAQTCYDFNQLGCTNPPQNTVAWFQVMGTQGGFIQRKGKNSIDVNRDAQLLVENSVALAQDAVSDPPKDQFTRCNE